MYTPTNRERDTESDYMGDIKAFLLPPVMEETKEAVITKRAKGPDGKPVPFVLRAIDQETNDRLIRRAQRTSKVNGQTVRELDTEKYGKLLISVCVIEDRKCVV